MNPHRLAAEIFGQMLSELLSKDRDLLTILRQGQHACNLAGFDDQRDWFKRELSGYQAEDVVPNYRLVRGQLSWMPSGSVSDLAAGLVAATGGEPFPQEEFTLEVRAPLSSLIPLSQSEYDEKTDRVESRYSIGRHREISYRASKNYPAGNFKSAVMAIETLVFDFASDSYKTLAFGDVMQGLWEDQRSLVDSTLASMQLATHLDTIRRNLQDTNPESWRSAAFACRSLLEDLAAYLWRDTRPTYLHLPGSGPDSNLPVTRDKFRNRIAAYLHYKGVSGGLNDHAMNELDRLTSSFETLVGLQGSAHSPIDRLTANSIALATYLLISELVRLTDMQPLDNYD